MSYLTIPEPVVAQMQTDLPAYDAKVMTQGCSQAQIILDDQVYILRITRAGKLILTK